MKRLSSIVRIAASIVLSWSFATSAFAADDPYKVAFGSFEILESEAQRVDSLLGHTLHPSYPRYDAPEGMTFLVMRWTLRPTFQKASPYAMASIPDEQVFVETDGVRSRVIGQCEADGTFIENYADLLAVDHENFVEVYPYCAVFLVPRTATVAKIELAKLKFEQPLEGEILPRFDWHNGLEIEVLKVEALPNAARVEGKYDSASEISYELNYELQPRSNAMLAVSVRLTPKRPDTRMKETPFSGSALDFRVAREGVPALMPIGQHFGSGFARLGEPGIYAKLAEDGTIAPIEATLVYPLTEPIEKATVLFRNAPLGEFDVVPPRSATGE